MSRGPGDRARCVERMDVEEWNPHPRRSTRQVKERRLTLIDARMAGRCESKKVCVKRTASEMDAGSQEAPRKAGKRVETDTASERSPKRAVSSTASTTSKDRPDSPQRVSRTDTGVSEDPFTKRRVGRQFEGVMKGCRALLTQIMIHKVRMWHAHWFSWVSGKGAGVNESTLTLFKPSCLPSELLMLGPCSSLPVQLGE